MNRDQDRDVEERLRGIGPSPIPAGLRERILSGTAKRLKERAVLTPHLRVCFIVSVFVCAASLAVDAFLSQRAAVQIAVFFPNVYEPEVTAEDPLFQAEIFAAIPDAKRLLKFRMPREHSGQKQLPFEQRGLENLERIEEEINGYKY